MPASSSTDRPVAPPVDAFPAYPASWYLFCESRQLRGDPLSKDLLGRRMVVFRTPSGGISVLDAHCFHQGADLGCGRVIDGALQCPFHAWRYGPDGACRAIPGARRIPVSARQRRWPATERHGQVFVFNGERPLFPLPFVLDENPDHFVGGRPFRYVADCTWYMNAAHAFDTQHFATVHDRKLIEPPRIDCPAPFARRNRYRAEVVGESRFDQMLRIVAGRTVEISLTIWGGTFAVITADFPRIRSAFLMSMLPLENGRTQCEGIVLVHRGHVSAWNAVNLRLRRLFTHGYLAEEARRLRGTRYHPSGFMDQDHDMVDFFRWVAALSRGSIHPQKEGNDEKDGNVVLDAVPGSARPLVGGRAAGGSGA